MADHRRTTGWDFGTVTVGRSSTSAEDDTMIYEWHPDAVTAAWLPSGYAISLVVG
jgi:hypothetical protein